MESMEQIFFSAEEQAAMACAIGAAAHNSEQYADALEWFNKAVEAGSAQAMCNLAYMYQKGQGVEKDEAEAQRLLKQAEALGEPRAAEMMESIKNGEL